MVSFSQSPSGTTPPNILFHEVSSNTHTKKYQTQNRSHLNIPQWDPQPEGRYSTPQLFVIHSSLCFIYQSYILLISQNLSSLIKFGLICLGKLELVVKKENQSLLAFPHCTLTSFYQRKIWFQLQLTGHQGHILIGFSLSDSFTFEKYFAGKYIGELTRLVLQKLHNENLFLVQNSGKISFESGIVTSADVSDLVSCDKNTGFEFLSKLAKSDESLDEDDLAIVKYVCNLLSERCAIMVSYLAWGWFVTRNFRRFAVSSSNFFARF